MAGTGKPLVKAAAAVRLHPAWANFVSNKKEIIRTIKYLLFKEVVKKKI
jgi:hypothetical protein